jgi:hypothetical protein
LLLFSLVLDLDDGLSSLVNDLVRPVLHVGLNIGVRELSSNESLGVEDGVVRVHGDLVLGGITDETLRVVESDVRRGGSVTLVVGDNLDTIDGEGPRKVRLKSLSYWKPPMDIMRAHAETHRSCRKTATHE